MGVMISEGTRKTKRRLRDAQRQKLYNAEDAVFDGHADKLRVTLEEAQALVNAVCAAALVQERYPLARHVPTVKRAHGRRNGACFDPSEWAIELDNAMQMKHVTLHELAHALVRPSRTQKVTPHGREFAECYLWLVRCFMGRHWSEALERSFKDHRVQFRPKRTQKISDEERERRREQGRRLAARR